LSFKDGQIAVAYQRSPVDPDTGYPLIPDTTEHTTAIVSYVTMKMVKRDFFRRREGSGSLLTVAENDWNWYCKQASNKDLMPSGIDDLQNLLDQRRRLLPKNQYFGFFGKMSVPEGRKWNDPDYRNYGLRYFRGNGGIV
jgi:hypothetical protein